MDMVFKNIDNIEVVLDLCSRLSDTQATFRLEGPPVADAGLYFHGLEWFLKVGKDRAEAYCYELNGRQGTAELNVEAFKPDDPWSLQTLFKTEKPATLSDDIVALPAELPLDARLTMDECVYLEVTIQIIEMKDRPATTTLPDITENMIWG